VMKPVEGTILTVAREAADAAADAVGECNDFLIVLDRAVEAARTALAQTREQLPVLKQAGVVDAGGRGYLLILEGALRHLQGKPVLPALEVVSADQPTSRAAAIEHAHFAHTDEGAYGYCTEFMITGSGLREDEVRAQLTALGDSLLVVGDAAVLRVHIHTDDPGRALSYAGGLGRLRRVKIEDMQEQHTEFAEEVPAAEPPVAAAVPPSTGHDARDALPIGVVTVASGPGFARIFTGLGATVVPGGQTMNPSTEQLLSAIDACSQEAVIVLPNNKNVVLTARQAAELSRKRVEVLPTETVPQGVAALLAVRFDEGDAAALAAMREAIGRVRTVELTTAVRDADLDGMQVRQGDILGLLDGKVALAGHDLTAVAVELLARLPADAYEVLTIYPGAAASAEQAATLAAVLGERFPGPQVETAEGGQPHYQFVISAE
jgi:fatty acid kinase